MELLVGCIVVFDNPSVALPVAWTVAFDVNVEFATVFGPAVVTVLFAFGDTVVIDVLTAPDVGKTVETGKLVDADVEVTDELVKGRVCWVKFAIAEELADEFDPNVEFKFVKFEGVTLEVFDCWVLFADNVMLFNKPIAVVEFIMMLDEFDNIDEFILLEVKFNTFEELLFEALDCCVLFAVIVMLVDDPVVIIEFKPVPFMEDMFVEIIWGIEVLIAFWLQNWPV